MMNFSVGSKSLLAKLMSEEDIRVEHKQIETAYFDVVNRVLALPMWKDMSSDLYDLLVGHEVGHALFTPKEPKVLDAAAKRSNKDFVNVVEDARIERMMKEKYAGLRTNFVKGYKELLARDFFGLQGKDITDLNLIDRINVYFKSRVSQTLIETQVFNEDEIPFIEKMEKMKTFDEVADVAAEIYEFIKERSESQESMMDQMPQIPQMSSEGEEGEESDFENQDSDQTNMTDGSGSANETSETDDENSEETSDSSSGNSGIGNDDTSDMLGDSSSNGQEENSEETEETEETSAGSEGTEDGTEEKDGEGDIQPQNQSTVGQEGVRKQKVMVAPKSLEDELVSTTDESSQDAMKQFVDKFANNVVYIDFGKIDLKHHIHDWTQVHAEQKKVIAQGSLTNTNASMNFEQLIKDNSKTINYLVKEFEMKKAATAHALSREAKSGRLNSGKLWSYKISEDLFMQKTIIPEGKNHGMVMLVDWSGSMYSHLQETVKQTIILSQFCKRVGIPFEVYTFTDQNPSASNLDFYKDNEIVPSSNIRLRNVLSSRMNARQYKECVKNWLLMVENYTASYYRREPWGADEMGGTPLNESLLILERTLSTFRKNNSLEKVNLVVLSDGDSNWSLDYKVTHDGQSFTNGINSYKTTNVITDKENNQKFEIGARDSSTTDKIVSYIRRKHHVNAMGFFLCSGRSDIKNAIEKFCIDYKTATNYYKTVEQYKEIRKKFTKEKFVVSTLTGYNEYYVINSKVDAKTDTLDVKSDMTKNQIAKSFASHSASKKANRQLLNKFVDLVK
tara:strand:- start:4423 stop:6792 length:2370 start_codon:yes stop_codon:yes gene_type:complete